MSHFKGIGKGRIKKEDVGSAIKKAEISNYKSGLSMRVYGVAL